MDRIRVPVMQNVLVVLLAVCFSNLSDNALSKDLATSSQARNILDRAGVQGGLIVHLGCDTGRVTAAFCDKEKYVVHGLDTDEAEIRKAREFIQSRGAYGTVSVRHWTKKRLPYGDNLVNLLVVEEAGGVSHSELMRVLAPRGVVCVRRENRWVTQQKPWPEELGEWTHWRHGPDRNPVAHDSVVGPPRRLQWLGAPRWQTHHNLTPSIGAMVSGGGRIFYIVNDMPPGIVGLPGRWFLVARDAFNGVVLWKKAIEKWGWEQWGRDQLSGGRHNKPLQLARRLVASDEAVYVTLGYDAPVTALDAGTGEVVKTYDGTECTSEILHQDDMLLLSIDMSLATSGKNDGVRLKAVDAETGETTWERGTYSGVRARRDKVIRKGMTRVALTAGKDKAFFLDGGEVVAINLDTGEEAWRAARPVEPGKKKPTTYGYYFPDLCTLVYHDGMVLLVQPRPVPTSPYTAEQARLWAFSAADGKKVWTRDCYSWAFTSPPDIFVMDGLVWAHDVDLPNFSSGTRYGRTMVGYSLMGLDLATGKEQRRIRTTEAFRMTHHHRCYRDKATTRFILTARRGVEYLDVATGRNLLHHWIRGTCRFGVLPSNGILYVPPHPCACYITAKLNGFYGLVPGPDKELEQLEPQGNEALEKGPAYGEFSEQQSAESTAMWSTYRHDSARSGATPATVSSKLTRTWGVGLPGLPGGLILADGKVLVGSQETHAVHALDADSGKERWSYTTEGPVDTPPTYYRGLVLFGSADGWLYCLRATDGRLVWRFQAAPDDRLVMNRQRLESAWPLHGSVLIYQDVAYVCAGRSSFLDGGLYLYALDPRTGQILQTERIYSVQPDTSQMVRSEMSYDMSPESPGAFNDILLTAQGNVYMRHMRFNPRDLSSYGLAGETERLEEVQRRVMTRTGPVLEDNNQYRALPQHPGRGPQLLSNSGLLDSDWFNQSFWTVGTLGRSRMLCFDAERICGVRAFGGNRRHARAFFSPRKDHYTLFALDRKSGKERWTNKLPVRVRAMILTRDTLFVAGPPNAVPEDEPWAAFDGRMGAKLCAVSVADGKMLAEYQLSAKPVYDSLIAVDGKLCLSLQDGRILCFEGG